MTFTRGWWWPALAKKFNKDWSQRTSQKVNISIVQQKSEILVDAWQMRPLQRVSSLLKRFMYVCKRFLRRQTKILRLSYPTAPFYTPTKQDKTGASRFPSISKSFSFIVEVLRDIHPPPVRCTATNTMPNIKRLPILYHYTIVK